MLELNQIYTGDCVEVMKLLDDASIDLVVTSPPYDNLRSYKGYTFDFESIAKELYRVVKLGGVVVWMVGDATIKGSETGTSFRQALYFKEIGFNLHDTMIWNKGSFTAIASLPYRYAPVFEYMFILSKGNLKSFNPIKDRPNKTSGERLHGFMRQSDGSLGKFIEKNGRVVQEFGQRFNIWQIPNPGKKGTEHPAIFPFQLAKDHIISWSNEGDLILDPMCGSGTTCRAARELDRNYIGIEISEEYVAEARSLLVDKR